MAFVVEDGTGLTLANSYATTAEADGYFSDRGNAAWTGLDAVKQAALIKATSFVDGRYFDLFIGKFPHQHTQGLLWPRVDAVDYRGFWFNGIPQCLKSAVCEAAVLFLADDLAAPLEHGGLVKEESASRGLFVSYQDGAPAETSYPAIDHAIRPILKGSGAGSSVKLARA